MILIHGRSFKPAKAELEAIWTEALRYGISRDFGDAKVGQFEHVDKELAYYGDFSNDLLLKRESPMTSERIWLTGVLRSKN